MKRLFITFSTVALLIYGSVNASEKANITPTHIEILDDICDYEEDYGQFIEIKHIVSEGSLPKSCLDKIVEINNRIDQWEADHPNFVKIVEWGVIIGFLVIIFPTFLTAPIATTFLLSACFVAVSAILQLIAKGEEYIIDTLVENGYSEEEVNKYVCAIFELSGKLFTVASFALPSMGRILPAARASLATYSKIGIEKAVAKRFTLSYKIEKQWKNFANNLKRFWEGFVKSFSTNLQKSLAIN
ncbi:MAG: hypothetical protein IJA14_00730 [Alphaproteobacteria bacterium]|nr:hypothetical protein [Alphaproteobacteria bacterium]